jgi:hypothetical protein
MMFQFLPRLRHRRHRSKWFFAFCLVSASLSSHAMSFYAAPPMLYLGGPVVPSDWAMWEEAILRFDGKITTIVFHDSGGGDSAAGRKIGNDIRKRMLSTVVSGRCSSACANMFLAGVTRQFSATLEKNKNVLGYHGSYNKSTKELNRKRTPDYFIEMTNGKMSEALIERFIRLENKSGLLRFYHQDQRKEGTPLALLCQGTEDRNRQTELCERLSDTDAVRVGVVTTWETKDIAAPPIPSREKATFASWRDNATPVPFVAGAPDYQGN